MIRKSFALVLAVLATTACVKLRHKTTVMPDGAGKFTLTVGMSAEMAEMLKSMGEALAGEEGKKAADSMVGKLADVPKTFEGAAAFTVPRQYEKDGFHYTEVTAYFEDVTKFRFRKPEGEDGPKGITSVAKGALSFKFEKTEGGGFTLTADNQLLGPEKDVKKKGMGSAGKSEEEKAEAKEMARAMLDGLELSETYELPGEVASADEPLTKSGRTAAYVITLDQLLEDMDKFADKPPVGTRKVVCTASVVSDADVKAFRAELEAAKKSWAEALAAEAAADAAAETEKKEPADGPKPIDEGAEK